MLNTSNSLVTQFGRQKDGREPGAQIKICFKVGARLSYQCIWMTTGKDSHKNGESRPLDFFPISLCMLGGCYKQLTCWLLTIHSYTGNPTVYLKRQCYCITQSQQSLTESVDSSSCLRLLTYSFFVQVYYLALSQSACWKPTKLFREG